jgi:hypothetical protein
MSTWMELRCEMRTDLPPQERFSPGRCWSHDNAGPMGMAHDSAASVARVFASLGRDAVKAGWKRTRDGWVCPGCIITAATLPTPRSTK